MLVHEAPEEPVPSSLPVTFSVVAHFQDIITGADIGFGGHEPTIGKLAHAVNIGNHDPIIGIDKEFHKPAVNFIGVDFAEEHEVAENHEALDVVAVAGLEDGADGIINGFNAGGGGVESVGHGAAKIPKVTGTFFSSFGFVDAADKFSPADELADDAFGGVDRNGVRLGMLQKGINNLLGLQQSGIDER